MSERIEELDSTALAMGLVAMLSVELTRIGVDPGTPLRTAFMLALAGLAVVVLLRRPFTTRGVGGPPMLLLLAAVVWSVLVGPLTALPLRNTAIALALTGTVVIGLSLGRRKGWEWFAARASLVLFVTLCAAMVWELRGGDGDRWVAFAEEANSLAELAAIGGVLAAAALGRKQWHYAPLAVVAAIVLVMTEARMPTVAAAFGGALALRPRLGREAPIAVLAAGSLLGLLIVVSPDTRSFVVNDVDAARISTLTGRTEVWDLLLFDLETAPLTGVGSDSGRLLLSARSEAMPWQPTHAHNAALQMLVNGGWPAATAFVASVLAYAVAVRRLPSSSRDGVVLAIAMIGVTEHLVREPSVPLLALAVAFGSIGARRSTEREFGPPARGERHDLVGVSN